VHCKYEDYGKCFHPDRELTTRSNDCVGMESCTLEEFSAYDFVYSEDYTPEELDIDDE